MTEVIVYQAPQTSAGPSGSVSETKPSIKSFKVKSSESFKTKIAKVSRISWRRLFKWGANLLILVSLLGLFLFYAPLLFFEARYQAQKKSQEVKPLVGFGELLKREFENPLLSPPDPYFSLVIPKIGAKSKIIANVDASSGQEYRQALKEGVAHAKGTVFPKMKGTIFLFAHSTDAPWNITRHNAVFYLLRELEPGDQVVIFFTGVRFNYRVVEKKVVSPSETDFFSQREKELLVLQTCYPPGTTREALLIFAEPE